MFFCNDALGPAGSGLDPDEWWKGAIVYQVYPRSFKDFNGNGIGNLEGTHSKLDYLRALGVDVLRFSPIYASPQADSGYGITDYYGIDLMFGTLSDLDRLLGGVHERGMCLIMDLVVNHPSDENPWFVESRSSQEGPKHDQYIWRDPHPRYVGGDAGAESNNWGSFLSDSAWVWDEATSQYYLRLFHKKQPDLDWENPQVCAAVYEMMSWWFDRGVDSLHMDVINLISKDPGLPDGVTYPGYAWGEDFPYFSEGLHPHEYLTEMRHEVFDGCAGTTTADKCPGVRRDNVLLFADPARCELDMMFQLGHVDLGLEARKFHPRPLCPGELVSYLTQWREVQGEVGWNSLYLDNRDQPRAVSRFGDEVWRYESAAALAATPHMLRGIPYVYRGKEPGMTNNIFGGIGDYWDVEALRYYRKAVELGENLGSVLKGLAFTGRDNACTPVRWDVSENAGSTRGILWIGVTPNYRDVNAASQVDGPSSMYAYYRVFTDIRHGLPVIVVDALERIAAPSPAILACRRTLDETVATIFVNLSSQSTLLGEAVRGVSGDLLLVNRDLPEGDRRIPETFGEWEALVYIR